MKKKIATSILAVSAAMTLGVSSSSAESARPHGVMNQGAQIAPPKDKGKVYTKQDRDKDAPRPKNMSRSSESMRPKNRGTTQTLSFVFGYTDSAVAKAGSVKAVEDQIALGLRQLNNALAASQIPVHVENAGIVKTSGANDSNSDAMLDELSNSTHSQFSSLVQARNRLKASGGIVYTAISGGYSGEAYKNMYFDPDVSYGVVDSMSLADVLLNKGTLAHEIGHILGGDHDPYAGGSQPAVGYVAPQNGVRDLMSYPSQCEAQRTVCDQENVFSDPTVTREGQRMGTSSQNVAGFMRSNASNYARLNGNKAITQTFVSNTFPGAGSQVSNTAVPVVRFSGDVRNAEQNVWLETIGGSRVPAQVSYANKQATITPNASLGTGMYRIVVNSGIVGSDGTEVGQQTIPFYVGSGPDAKTYGSASSGTRPMIQVNAPLDVDSSNIEIVGPGNKKVPWDWSGMGTITSDGYALWKLTPSVALSPNTTYTVRMTGVRKSPTQPIGSAGQFTFTTH